jgi:CDP-glucose 4,6-dehydratase
LKLSSLRLDRIFSGKKVLVTGHTGFKGSWLCEWLHMLGADIVGFSLPQAPSHPSLFDQLGLAARIKDTRGDIRNRGILANWVALNSPDFVFHLAAQPLVRTSYADPVATWEVNAMGTIHLLEALREVVKPCSAVLITTDKVYENREWDCGYREEDSLGGCDPYSSSKAAAEIAIASWRRSFFDNENEPTRRVAIASARAGNVIGGGDWAQDRIVPDAMRALAKGLPIPMRNRYSTRPWQHVLEPLSGYLLLGARLAQRSEKGHPDICRALNFGPDLSANCTVECLVNQILEHWPGFWEDRFDSSAPHEAGKLNLATDRAYHLLGWRPVWNFETAVAKTVEWYRAVFDGGSPVEWTRKQIEQYCED